MAVWHLARNRGQVWGCRLSHEEQALRDARAPVGRYGATAFLRGRRERSTSARTSRMSVQPTTIARTEGFITARATHGPILCIPLGKRARSNPPGW
jgi:hypothetical protein